MSLDVYLEVEHAAEVGSDPFIYVRVGGRTRSVSRAEWDILYPGREPVMVTQENETMTVYHGNITHNLGKMAKAAGIYPALWRPEEVGIVKAGNLVEPLQKGLAELRADPERFEALNPENGWGTYEGLLAFAAEYLIACMVYPEATIRVWR